MTGIIVTTPPTVELPPGSTSSNPATLPPVTYRYALLNIPQTWTAKQTFPLGMITLNAADITGTLPAADLPPPTTITLGGIFSKANVANQWINSIGTDGTPTSSQPVITDISGLATGISAFLVTPSSANLITAVTNETGTGSLVFANTPTLVTPVLGVATATTINGITITPASGTLTLNTNTLAIGGSAASLIFTPASSATTTMTLPTTSATLARTDAGQTFTGTNNFGTIGITGTATIVSASADSFDVGLNGATNPSFKVDNSTASQVAGLSVKGAVTGGTVLLTAIDSGANASVSLKPKGSGVINLTADTGNTSTVNIGTANVSGATFTMAGFSSGSLAFLAPAAASGTLTFAPGTMTGSSASAIWYDNIPQNSQSAAYGLVLADAQKHILHPSADTTARTWTIPANASVAYPIGTAVTFVNQNAAGVITIAITTDTMRLAGAGTTGNRSLAANGIATAIKLTSTEWLISGTGLT